MRFVHGAEELARVGAAMSRRLFEGFPSKIGRYRIAGRIASGGMGQVFRGHDPALDRPVAVKVLGPNRPGAIDAEVLLQEARALASISHPNVVEVFEVGTDDGVVFIAMELVDGTTLDDWRTDERPGWVEIVRVYVQAGDGLAAAHQAGLVHRDFKPSNVLLGRDGRARVLDFGLAAPCVARVTGGLDVEAGRQALGWAGTPAYMAPECVRGERASARSDQFSYCVALWEALFGGRPYAAKTVRGARRLAETGRLLRPGKTSVPNVIIDALSRGLSPDPQARWPSMAPLLQVLRARVRPRGPFRAAVFVTGWVGWKVAAGAVLVAFFPGLGDADPCAVLRTKRDEDWSAERRDGLADRFASQGRAEAWPSFEEAVDAQMAGLPETYASACEALRIDEGTVRLDTELACLRRRYLSVQRLLDAAFVADAPQLERIEAMVINARGAGDCDEAGAPVVLPPRIVAGVADADAQLAEVDVLRTEDRYDAAAALLDQLAADALVLRYEPLQARVAMARADVEMVRGNTDLAEDALVSSYQLAVGSSDHRLAMRSSASLAQLVGVERSRPAEALEWARHSEAAARRLGESEPQAHLWRTLGHVHFNAGDYVVAAEMFAKAAAAMQDDATASRSQRVELLRKLGGIELHLEHPDVAAGHFEHALQLAEIEYGPDTHNVAALSFNLGLTMHEPARAVPLFERAARVYATLFERHPDLGDALYRWGRALAALGREAEGEEKMREGIAMLAEGIGDTHPYVLDCRSSLVEVMLARRDFAGAFELAMSVHADAQAELGDAHPVTAGARQLVGAALDGLGDAEAAREAFEDAARLSKESPQPDPRMVLRTTASLAEFRARNGEPDQGRAQLEAAADDAREVVGASHPLWADLQLRALALLPESEGGPKDLEQARAALEILGQGAQGRSYTVAMFSLARLEHAHGDRAQARARAESVAARLRQEPGAEALSKEVERWLAATRP